MLFEKGERLRSELRIDHLLVTMGELGITLLDSCGVRRFPAQAREVYDVSGAGDTVIAMLSAAIAAGLSLDDSVRLANIAAGLVVSKLGTTAVDKNELIAALSPLDNDTRREQKICSPRELFELVARWRLAGRRIVFTNGCFDLLHVGHLALLEQARRMGDYLIVALNNDRSVRAVKGPGRPILSENARANLLAALPCVDAVVLFDEDTPVSLIQELRPDVLAKGGDYLEEEVIGTNEMRTWGGKVVLIPLVKEFKTRAILKKATANLHDGSGEFVQLQPESAVSH